MKKIIWLVLFAAVLLSACNENQALETVTDVYAPDTVAVQKQISLQLPADALSATVHAQEDGKLYICDNYTIHTYTRQAGDLQKTVTDLTGYTPKQLSIIKTNSDDMDLYRFVWTAAGEAEQQVGRGCILDDGNFHYVLSVMSNESYAGMLNEDSWQSVFRSFRAVTEDQMVSSGS